MRTSGTDGSDDVLLVDLDHGTTSSTGARSAPWDRGAATWDGDADTDDDDLGSPDDDGWPPRSSRAPGPGGSQRPLRRTGRRSRRAAAGVAAGAVAVVVVLVGASSALRSPQERVQDRLTEALESAGVRLAEPVSLQDDGSDGVWTGRLRVVGPGGSVSGVRVALRPDPVDAAGERSTGPATGLFPLVDCASPYPLSWAGDSDTSFRTTRADLAECVAEDRDGGVVVTIAWQDDDGDGDGAEGRQTWRTDGSGGVVWLHNGSSDRREEGDGASGPAGLTGEQQRAVATAAGIIDPV